METKEKKKQVTFIASMEEDFAQWYTDVVRKAELCEYTSVKGCMVIKPYGYAIWENIQQELNQRFKKTGIENVAMPMLIPESLLNKEKDHVEGFAPEVAWVTHGGKERLEERLCIRPTSETLFCDFYSSEIRSWRDLPKLYNQWCSVMRWEKTTRPFLRSREFLWQEGHTAHATQTEAEKRTQQMLHLYGDFLEEYLAIPVIRGRKTEKEKFAGAKATYTLEALMHDGKALQAGTAHDFGDGFARAFNIQYLDQNNQLQYVHQTSWGMTTRLIGAIIMVHGDERGLVLPPLVAPCQILIIPIQTQKDGVIEKAMEIKERLSMWRTQMDLTDHSPGYKFSNQEMRGIPLRIEIGPRDCKQNTVLFVRRDTLQKESVSVDQLEERVKEVLLEIQQNLFEKAKARLEHSIYYANTKEEFLSDAKKSGLISAYWCGKQDCEERLKEEAEVTSRCIPFQTVPNEARCICCNDKAKHAVIWGKAY